MLELLWQTSKFEGQDIQGSGQVTTDLLQRPEKTLLTLCLWRS